MTTPSSQIYQRYKNLIPLGVFTVLCIITLITRFSETREADGTYSHIILTWKHYGAFAAVLLNYVAFFGFRPHFKKTFIAMLLLGLFGLINFTVTDSLWHLKMGNTTVFILQPTSFYVALLTLVLNYKTIRARQEKSEPPAENLQSNEKYYREDLEKFKSKYANYPTEDLEKIIADRRFTAAALDAAAQLLSERQATQEAD